MRKLTKNELIELRACKEMDNAQMEFFQRAKRMYQDDPDAVAKLDELEKMYQEVEDLFNAEDPNSKASQAYDQARNMYYGKADSLLEEMGYTPKPEAKPNDIFDVLERRFGKPDEETLGQR